MKQHDDGAGDEPERRGEVLGDLGRSKLADGAEEGVSGKVPVAAAPADGEERKAVVRVVAADMPPALQRRAFRCARDALAGMPQFPRRLEPKRLALALKKEFDAAYGPAWHCIVGTSFGSYVTHARGGFLYFSVDKVYILLFRTAVEPLPH